MDDEVGVHSANGDSTPVNGGRSVEPARIPGVLTFMTDTTEQTRVADEAPVLAVRGAKKRFGETRALGGVDLEVAPGEWLALLGPNGAGKTTLVRAISGLVKLDAGAVTLCGTDVARGRDDGSRRALGLVPQEIALYPRLTATENLSAWGRLMGVGDGLSERVDWALEWTGLASRRDDRVDTYSGGMKRRLNIACAVLHEPRLLLLDEPTVGVDPQSRQRIWIMLDALRRSGTALLLTTHQLDEAQQQSDRIVIIDRGQVVAEGDLDTLVRDTVGTGRRVQLRFAETVDADALPPNLAPDGDRTATTALGDVARELPMLLAQLRDHGLEVSDLDVTAPSLESVFIHLTGRELRE